MAPAAGGGSPAAGCGLAPAGVRRAVGGASVRRGRSLAAGWAS